jgi:hypothetical protein
MHGIEDFLFYALVGCLLVSFLIEFALNKRPFVVAFAVPIALYGISLVWDAIVFGRIDSTLALISFSIFAVGGLIGSLIGSGTARALRLWIKFWREQTG